MRRSSRAGLALNDSQRLGLPVRARSLSHRGLARRVGLLPPWGRFVRSLALRREGSRAAGRCLPSYVWLVPSALPSNAALVQPAFGHL